MARQWLERLGTFALGAIVAVLAASAAFAQGDVCKNRGQLDTLYCDEDGDLIADVPKDPKRWHDPSTLVFAYTPVEDPAIYHNMFKPFTEYLGQCTGKRVVYYPVQSNSAEIEAMRSGRLHVGAFATGPTAFAVNLAGAVPFAAMAKDNQATGYKLVSIVKSDSPYRKLADLKGKRVAHTAPSSNSGHIAALVLYPEQGLRPNEDYKPLMSGGHDKSVLGVMSGDYDMAGVASTVFERMAVRGVTKLENFRVIYESRLFPTTSIAYAHDLKPELAKKLTDCFFAYPFTPELIKEFNGSDRFVPISYKDHWAVVREVADKSGTPYNKAAYDKEAQREAAELSKKRPSAPQPKQ